MLNMSLPEITRIIGETEYKQEIDELGATFKGIDLIEVALSWNLAKEYQKIQEITPGNSETVHPGVPPPLGYPECLTLLRGKMQGEKTGKIKEILIPAGSLDRAILDRLLGRGQSGHGSSSRSKAYRMYPRSLHGNIRWQRKADRSHGWKMNCTSSSMQR